MAKSRDKAKPAFEPDVAERLEQIAPYELVTDPGYCEIHFEEVEALTSKLTEFEMIWDVHSNGKGLPTPDEHLFEIWERYQKQHAKRCDEYRERLFALFSKSSQATYDERQWKLLRRTKPTRDDLHSVVSSGTVTLSQYQHKSEMEYELRVSFNIFWDEHGTEFQLNPEAEDCPIVE